MVIKDNLKSLVKKALIATGVENAVFNIENPNDFKLGDFSTNVAIKYREKKDDIFSYIKENKLPEIERVEMVGPGFINFYLSKEFFRKSLGEIIEKRDSFGKNEIAKNLRVMIEHTDPNPFKEFHIGHFMPNVIGSTIARIFEWNGALVKQVSYQGDVGVHVAKAVWAMLHGSKLMVAYSTGNKAYEENLEAKKEIDDLNKKIYQKSDPDVNNIYEDGRKKSLEYFEGIYKKIDTKFDYYFFESETAPLGKKIVEENLGKVFEESDGAIVFKGEKYDPTLHTRVFINSHGISTYEAKDLGNAKNKQDVWPHDISIVVTGNEQKDYFRVVLSALTQIYPELANKTKHLSHGMLRLSTGKMSSRTGNVITAEELINDVKEKVKGDEHVAVGAIKYMILRQGIGQDIIFDFEKSVSTEGDSGVYLQYAHARACSILIKKELGNSNKQPASTPIDNYSYGTRDIEKLLYIFPDIVLRAGEDLAPNYITTYLTKLAGAFNSFYANEQVLNTSDESYKLMIVEAFKITMKNGLNILGIPAPEKM